MDQSHLHLRSAGAPNVRRPPFETRHISAQKLINQAAGNATKINASGVAITPLCGADLRVSAHVHDVMLYLFR